ncbi:ALF repeat-containing protein, partial [Streptomyces sp. NPDC007325]|uniref:ALF repeat-containing protein n=1 Tax=Streptomyces sp. NPDC007325 TaxID=3154588 RepID=UPI0033D0BD24
RAAATSAAEHAENAAAAAELAAEKAGQASGAAAEATKQAEESRKAADVATSAVAAAKNVFAVARDLEAEDLATRTAAATERARDEKAADDAFTLVLGHAMKASMTLDNQLKELAAEATDPGVDVTALAAKGRKAALELMKTRGPWVAEAAGEALSGTDQEVVDFLRTGWSKAQKDDARQRVARLSLESPSEAVRAEAAEVALQSDAQVESFLTDRQHQIGATDNRVAVTQIHSSGGDEVRRAAQTALQDSSPKALATFLYVGQYRAQRTDDRLKATEEYSRGGPEVKAGAKVALLGSPERLRAFVATGLHIADRKDQLAATHVAELQNLIAEMGITAAEAQANAWEATKAAAVANNAKAEAEAASAQAAKSAELAGKYAKDADHSATAAEASAAKAANSAAAARTAAASANADAAAAEASAARARLSAQWARVSASEAREASEKAFAASIAAGKDRDDANTAASEAWKITADKMIAEEAEELRRAQEEEDKKKGHPCPVVPRQGYEGALAACLLTQEDAYVDMESLKSSTEVYKEFIGVNDALKCWNDPTLADCTMVAIAVTPLGKIKAVKKLDDLIDKAGELPAGNDVSRFAQASKAFRPTVTWANESWDGWAMTARKHRKGGGLDGPDKGIFEGPFVKGNKLKRRIQEAVDRMPTPRKNDGFNPDGTPRDGWVYEWDFGPGNKIGRHSEEHIAKHNLTGDAQYTTRIRVILFPDGSLRTAHPI